MDPKTRNLVTEIYKTLAKYVQTLPPGGVEFTLSGLMKGNAAWESTLGGIHSGAGRRFFDNCQERTVSYDEDCGLSYDLTSPLHNADGSPQPAVRLNGRWYTAVCLYKDEKPIPYFIKAV